MKRAEGLKKKVCPAHICLKRDRELLIDNNVAVCQSKKLNDLQMNCGAPTLQVIRERLQHLAAIEDVQSVLSPEFTRWADTRLDRWLIDWTLRHGKEKTARRIAAEKGIEVR